VPPSNTSLLRSARVHNPNGISIGSAIFAQLTAVSSGMPDMFFPLKIAPLQEDLNPDLIHASLCLPESSTICTSIGSAVLARLTSECHWPCRSTSFPSKLPLHMGDLDHHLIRGCLGPPDSASQTASRSVQPFLGRIARYRPSSVVCRSVCHTSEPCKNG